MKGSLENDNDQNKRIVSQIWLNEGMKHKTHYVGETKRSFRIRDSEHRKAAQQQRWSHSGLTQHMEKCNARIEGPKILCTSDDRKKNPKFDLRITEALHIRRLNCGPGKGMNEDWGSYVTTQQWQPVFNRMNRAGRGQGFIPSFSQIWLTNLYFGHCYSPGFLSSYALIGQRT